MLNFTKLLKKFKNSLLSPLILADFVKFNVLSVQWRFSNRFKDIYPSPFDKTFTTNFDRHYIYHTAWAARTLKKYSPARHSDIGSSLFFSGIVSAFFPVDFYDYRPADIELTNLQSKQGNILSLPFADNSISSLSCMHVVEHIGLGRYGDALDPDGDLKAIIELKRVVAAGGSLLFVVPMGKPKIMFNAHRIYGYTQIVEQFKNFTINEFAFIPEHSGGIIYNASPARVAEEEYGCGCFWLVKNVV